MELFSPLTSKLNKYLINIIDQYYCININKLVNEKLPIRETVVYN